MDGTTLDTLGRRPRAFRTPTGKRVTLRDRDLFLFEKILHHGYLSSAAIRGYQTGTDKCATQRLGDLFHEDNTPHGGPYLNRPTGQFETINPRNNDLIYELDVAAINALKEYALWSDYAFKPGRTWKHDYGVAAVTSSIELGTLNTNVRFIPGHEILERAEAKLYFPTKIDFNTVNLLPDALFGLETTEGDDKYYRFFCVEFDRGTEPVSGKTYSRKSHERNVEQYRQFIAQSQYKDALGLSAGMMVMYVTINETRMNNFIELTDNNYSLFAAVPELGGIFKPVKPLNLFARPWSRHNRPAFHINTVDGKPPHGSV